jgi:biopolymer transport protein ExbB/TolQ
MSSTACGIVGAIVCVGGFQLLKYGVERSAGYVFAGIVVVAAIVMHLVYQRRLARVRDDVDEMSEELRSRFLQDIDPEIAEDLRRTDDDKSDA